LSPDDPGHFIQAPSSKLIRPFAGNVPVELFDHRRARARNFLVFSFHSQFSRYIDGAIRICIARDYISTIFLYDVHQQVADQFILFNLLLSHDISGFFCEGGQLMSVSESNLTLTVLRRRQYWILIFAVSCFWQQFSCDIVTRTVGIACRNL